MTGPGFTMRPEVRERDRPGIGPWRKPWINKRYRPAPRWWLLRRSNVVDLTQPRPETAPDPAGAVDRQRARARRHRRQQGRDRR